MAGAARRRRTIESGVCGSLGKRAATPQSGIVEWQVDICFAQGGRRFACGHGFRRIAGRSDDVRKSERPERRYLAMDGRASAFSGKKIDSEMGKADRLV